MNQINYISPNNNNNNAIKQENTTTTTPTPPSYYSRRTVKEILLQCLYNTIGVIKDSIAAAIIAGYLYDYYILLIQFINLTETNTILLLTSILHIFLYLSINTLYYLFDLTGLFYSYKLPRKYYQLPSSILIKKTILYSIGNQLIIQPIGFYFIYPLFKLFGTPSYISSLSPLSTLIKQFLFFWFLNEIIIYCVHRMMHLPLFYRLFHKKHHEYIGTIGFAAEYVHPVDSFFSHLLPTSIGPILCGCHQLVWLIWLSWRLFSAYTHHSGYYFNMKFIYIPFFISNPDWVSHHDLHHTVNKGKTILI
jgi:sterol desaturase/sphingolipid hydroxylase (fatty acid hydroxylase superfamily)